MHSPRPVSAENTLRGRAAAALYHNPARMCQKASIRTARKGERTRIRANRTAKPQSHTPERRRVVKSQAELVRLLSRWCVYFRALRKFFMSHFCPSWGRAGAETPCFIGFSGFSALRHRLRRFFSPAEPQPLARASPAPSRPRAGARTAAGAFVLPTKTSAGSTMDMASACLMAGSIPNPGWPVQERSENVANVEMLPVPMLPMANGAARRPAGDLRAWKPATPNEAPLPPRGRAVDGVAGGERNDVR